MLGLGRQPLRQGNEFVSDPERLARRLFNWLALWSPALSGGGPNETSADVSGGSRLLDRRRSSVLRQLTLLRGQIKSMPQGLSRLTAGCALALGGARIADGRSQFLERGLDLLDTELPLQILPDGGHISRSPESCVTALKQLLTLDTSCRGQLTAWRPWSLFSAVRAESSHRFTAAAKSQPPI